MPIPVAVGAAMVKGGADLLNTIIGSGSNANLNSKNRKWQAQQNTLQYERQRELTEDSPLLQKIGLQKAGISTAAMNGYTGGTATVSASNNPTSVPEYQPMSSDFINAFLAGKSLENEIKTSDKYRDLLDKQADLLDQNIEKQKMDNEVQRNTINAYERASSKSYFVGDDGEKHFADDSDYDAAVTTYMKNHNNEFPEVVTTNPLKSFEAINVPKVISDIRTQIRANEYYKVHYDLMQSVEQMKLNNPHIMFALARMDQAQYMNILANISKISSDIDLNKYRKQFLTAQTAGERARVALTFAQIPQVKQTIQTMRNSNAANIIDQMADSHSVGDFLLNGSKLLLTVGSSLIGGFGPKTKVYSHTTNTKNQYIDDYDVNINN